VFYLTQGYTRDNVSKNKNGCETKKAALTKQKPTKNKNQPTMQKVYLAWTHAVRSITEKKPLRVTALFFVLLASVTVYISIYAGSAQAAANTNINFQARVLSNAGAVVSDGFYSVEFNLYTQSAGGVSQWTETQVVTSKNGYITVSLGSVTPFGSGIDWSQEQWLSMNINGDGEMSPRMKVTAVPLAFRANQADSLTTPTGTVSSSQLAQLSPGLVQSTSSASAALRINQTGSGDLLQLQSSGSNILTLSNAGDLSIVRGLTVGNSTNTVAGTIRWTGMAFEGYNGSAWASLGSGGGAGSLINIVKPANEIVNNSNALQNDDHLTFPIGANEEYTYRFVIQANSGTTPDLRFAVTAPAGATCRVSYADIEGATSNGQYGCGVTTASIPGNGAVDLYEITGSVTNGATPGSVTLQWAQFTANASNTIVYAGSYVQAIRSIGAGSSGQVFVQDGNAFGETAILGTSDNNNLALISNGIERLTVSSNGNIGIGDTTPSALFTVGTNDALQVDANGNLLTSGTLTVGGLTTINGSLVANGSTTGATGVTSGSGSSTTTLTLAADSFNINDVVFIDNVGQDYYTRIITDPGTGSYTVSPSVTFENGRSVTKYNMQNIGATTSDYSSQANRFFQGYFLGGLVVGAGSTTISDGNINSTTTLRLQEGGGDVSVGGALSVSGILSGDASGLTNINGASITSGSIADGSLSTNVTLLGNTFNGANQLVQLNASSELPGLSGANLTNLNADNIASGTLNDSRLSSNVTLLGNTFNGINQLVRLDGAGKIGDSLLSSNITAAGNTFNGNSQLVQLTGTGALPALNGSGLTSLNGSNIISGTVADARLSTNVTLLGNTFNGANQLVQLDGTGILPTLSGTNLTGLSATNISTGTLSDSRLSSNVGLTNLSQTYSAQQTFAANILLGTDSASPTAGTLAFNDSVGSNGFTSVLGTSTLSASRNINLPDESGTICLNNSVNCGFILMAPGSAQADSSTNNMLYLNKTGASGDILNLQKNGTSILRMLNSGALQMTLTSTTAFTIENAGGTDYFNVDTSGGLVRIGGAAADATGVLLVLDTKNTAGDPTGTNGGMYYNSVDNKNRCYENGVWSDCSTTRVAGETTLGAANGTINVTLNGNYEYLHCRIDTKGRSAAGGIYLRFNNDTGAASYGWNEYDIINTAVGDAQDSSDSEIQLTGTDTGNIPASADLRITNFQDTQKIVDWSYSGVTGIGTNNRRYSGTGNWANTTNFITSVQFVTSTGTFNAGSHAWCEGRNVR